MSARIALVDFCQNCRVNPTGFYCKACECCYCTSCLHKHLKLKGCGDNTYVRSEKVINELRLEVQNLEEEASRYKTNVVKALESASSDAANLSKTTEETLVQLETLRQKVHQELQQREEAFRSKAKEAAEKCTPALQELIRAKHDLARATLELQEFVESTAGDERALLKDIQRKMQLVWPTVRRAERLLGLVSHIPVFSAQHTIVDMGAGRLPEAFLDFRRVDSADVEEIPLPDDEQALALVPRT